MTDFAAPPPSYDSVISLAEKRIGDNLTPEKVLYVASNLSATESQALANVEVDPHTLLEGLDQDAFNQGLHAYLKSEDAKRRLEANADEATKACQLINTMFSNLAVRLGEYDSKNIGTIKFMPTFRVLQNRYTDTLQKSAKLAMSMGSYAARFEEKILRVVLDARIKYEKKKEYLDEYINDAAQFEKDSKAIHDGFTSLQIDFGAFTGSFESWAQGEENKHAKDIEDLGKEIAALEKEISDIKGKMALWGGIGAVGTVGATVGLVLLLGPVGLLAGLIGAGVTIGFMVHWNNEITNRNQLKGEKEKKLREYTSERDAIIATRAQLVLLGQNSFDTFQKQLSKLTEVWTHAMNDAHNVKIALEQLKKDGKDMDDEALRQILVLPAVGNVSGLYSVMATYLNRYADGVNKTL